MARGKKKPAKMGRPQFEMTPDRWKLLDLALTYHSTELEAAAQLGCSVATLKRIVQRERETTFELYRKEKASVGRAMLRARLWKSALAGDRTMGIWLSKNELGMRDESHVAADVNAKQAQTHYYVPDNGRGDTSHDAVAPAQGEADGRITDDAGPAGDPASIAH